MHYISNELIVEIYKDALIHETHHDFITLIELELERRGLLEDTQKKFAKLINS